MKNRLLVLFSLSFLGLTACQKANTGSTASTNNSEHNQLDSKLDITGQYETDCLLMSPGNVPTQFRVKINESEVRVEKSVYGMYDNTCRNEQHRLTMISKKDARGMALKKLNDLDLPELSFELVARNERVASIFRNSKMCGLQDWLANQVKLIKGKRCANIDVPNQYFTVLEVADKDKVMLGEFKLDGTGAGSANRVRTLMPYVFKKTN